MDPESTTSSLSWWSADPAAPHFPFIAPGFSVRLKNVRNSITSCCCRGWVHPLVAETQDIMDHKSVGVPACINDRNELPTGPCKMPMLEYPSSQSKHKVRALA